MIEVNVSVVIPAYNRAHTIKRCINSVLSQTYPVYEIIVVDDSSTDNLLSVINELNYCIIRLIKHEINKGSQASRNTGINAASGDWIAFLDSDDEWLPDKIEKQVAQISLFGNSPYLFIHTGCFVYDYSRNMRYIFPHPIIEGAEAFKKLLQQPGPSFPGILTSKIALQNIGFLDENVLTHQEWETSIRLAEICQVVFIPEPLFIWNLIDNFSISKNKRNGILGYSYIIAKHSDKIQCIDNGYSLLNHYRIIIRKALESGFFTLADKFLEELNHSDDFELFELKIFRTLRLRPPEFGTRLYKLQRFIAINLFKLWRKVKMHNFKRYAEAIFWRFFKLGDKLILSKTGNYFDKTLMIIKLDAIGDYILFRNFLEILKGSQKYHEFKITLLGNSLWRSIAETADKEFVDHFIWVNPKKLENNRFYRFKTLWSLRSIQYHTLLYPNYSRHFNLGDEIVFFIKALHKYASRGETGLIPESEKLKHDAIYSTLFNTLPQPCFEFYQYRNLIYQFLQEEPVLKKPFFRIPKNIENNIVVFIGAGQKKRKWGIENYARLISYLCKEFNEEIILQGGIQEKYEAELILSLVNCKNKITNNVGKYSLWEMMQDISSAKLLVSNESSAIHIAVAVNTPSVCISNGNHYGRFNPYPAEITQKVKTIYPSKITHLIEKDEYSTIYEQFNKGSELNINEVQFNDVIEAISTFLKNI